MSNCIKRNGTDGIRLRFVLEYLSRGDRSLGSFFVIVSVCFIGIWSVYGVEWEHPSNFWKRIVRVLKGIMRDMKDSRGFHNNHASFHYNHAGLSKNL